jgi:hypothetical protein
LRECTKSDTKPEGSKRALQKDLEQRWVSVGIKKFLKKFIHKQQSLNVISTALNLNLQYQSTNTTSGTTTDRMVIIESITRELTTLGNQIFHQKVPNEEVLSFVEAKQKQLEEPQVPTLKRNLSPNSENEGRKKEKERKSSTSSSTIPIPRLNSDQTSPRGKSSERKALASPTSTSSSFASTSTTSPPTPEKTKKPRKQENGAGGTRVKQPKF